MQTLPLFPELMQPILTTQMTSASTPISALASTPISTLAATPISIIDTTPDLLDSFGQPDEHMKIAMNLAKALHEQHCRNKVRRRSVSGLRAPPSDKIVHAICGHLLASLREPDFPAARRKQGFIR